MVLNDREIRKCLEAGKIFVEDSWTESSIRGAAYDVRLACDYLVTPDGKHHLTESPLDDPLVLKPGERAVVSTLERFCLDWELTARINGKFSTVRRGLLVMAGGLVDPGFGLELKGCSNWEPKAD